MTRYSTSFAGTEAPVSEGGAWINQSTNRTLVDTSGGIAFGTQVGGAFDDSYAHLTAAWPSADYTIEATVSKGSTSGIQEVELLFRVTDSAGSPNVHLYEINFAHNGQYVDFVRWDGGISGPDFTYLIPSQTFNIPGGVNNGDILRGRMVGNKLTAWINQGSGFALIGSASDTAGPNGGAVYTTGTPGIGFFKTAGSGAMNQYAFSDFLAETAQGALFFGAGS